MTSPTPPASTEVNLCRGLIDYLVTLGPDVLNYDAAAAYGDTFGRPAAFIMSWPAAPDRVASFTPYTIGDDAGEPMSRMAVQVRTRWAGSNPLAVQNYSAELFDALHGLGPLTLSTGVSISQCLRQSSASLGQDGTSRRWSWSDNYYVDLDRPTTHRAGG